MIWQRGETDFFSGEPLRALSTLVFSDNVDLQRSASLTFAEITERGTFIIEVFEVAGDNPVRNSVVRFLKGISTNPNLRSACRVDQTNWDLFAVQRWMLITS